MTALLGYLLCIMMQVFFIIPCIDIYEKIDLRTQTYDVPPQEVEKSFNDIMLQIIMLMLCWEGDQENVDDDGCRSGGDDDDDGIYQ